MNCVRRHLSRIKNGGLLEAAASTKVVSLLMSDVADSPPNVIASGPTMADETTKDQALSILEKRLGSRLPPKVRSVFTQKSAARPPVDSHIWKVIADGETAAVAAATTLMTTDVPTMIASSTLRGEAREEAQTRVMNSKPGVSIFAGETIVSGALSGQGGRNQEASLAAATAIDGRPGHLFAALGTDGIDGPTDAAGAIVDSETVTRGRLLSLDASEHHESHNSHPFLAATGDLIRTGPTGTNVGDLWVTSAP